MKEDEGEDVVERDRWKEVGNEAHVLALCPSAADWERERLIIFG